MSSLPSSTEDPLSGQSVDQLITLFKSIRVEISEMGKAEAIKQFTDFFSAFKTALLTEEIESQAQAAKFNRLTQLFENKFRGLGNLLGKAECRKFQMLLHPDKNTGVGGFSTQLFQLTAKTSSDSDALLGVPEEKHAADRPSEQKEVNSAVHSESGVSKECSTRIRKINSAKDIDKLDFFSSAKKDKASKDRDLFRHIKSVTDFMAIWRVFERIPNSVDERNSYLSQFLRLNYESWNLKKVRKEARNLAFKIKSGKELISLAALCQERGLLHDFLVQPNVLDRLKRAYPMEPLDREELRAFLEILKSSPSLGVDLLLIIRNSEELVGVLSVLATLNIEIETKELMKSFCERESWRASVFASTVKKMTEAFSTEGIESTYQSHLIHLFAGQMQEASQVFHTLKALVAIGASNQASTFLSNPIVSSLIVREYRPQGVFGLNELTSKLLGTGLTVNATLMFLKSEAASLFDLLKAAQTSLEAVKNFINLFDKGTLTLNFFKDISGKFKISLYEQSYRRLQAHRGAEAEILIKAEMDYLRGCVADEDLVKVMLMITNPDLNFSESLDHQYLGLTLKYGMKPVIEYDSSWAKKILSLFKLDSIELFLTLKNLLLETFAELPAATQTLEAECKNFLRDKASSFKVNDINDIFNILQALKNANLSSVVGSLLKSLSGKIQTVDQGIEVLSQLTDRTDQRTLLEGLIPKVETLEDLCHLFEAMGYEEGRLIEREAALSHYLNRIKTLEDLVTFIAMISHKDQRIFSSFTQWLDKDPLTGGAPLSRNTRANFVLGTLVNFFKETKTEASVRHQTIRLGVGVISEQFERRLKNEIQELITQFLAHHSKTRSTNKILSVLQNFDQSSSQEKHVAIHKIRAILDDSDMRNWQYEHSWCFRLFHGKRSQEAEALYGKIRERALFMGDFPESMVGKSPQSSTIIVTEGLSLT